MAGEAEQRGAGQPRKRWVATQPRLVVDLFDVLIGDRDRRARFTEPGVPAIGRITPDGQITEFSTGLNRGSTRSRSWAGRTATCG